MNLPAEQPSQPTIASIGWIMPGRRIDILASVRNHSKVIWMIALPITMLGLVSALLFGRPVYKATASVRILPTYGTALGTGIDSSLIPNIEYRSFVQQQVFEIANPETIIEALKLLGPRVSVWQLPKESEQHAAERLLEYLKVEWIPDTFLIMITLEGTKPQDLDVIVNAVVDAYLSRQERQELSGADTRVKLLEERKKNLQSTTDAERIELSQLAQELGVSTFSTGASDPYNRKLADANIALERQQRLLIAEQAHLSALEAQKSRPADADLDSLAQNVLLENPDLVAQKTQLEKQREVLFLQLQGLAPAHPGRAVLERGISDIDRETDLIDRKAMDGARSILLGTRSAAAHDKIADAQTRVDQAQRALDGIAQEVSELKASVASFGAKYNQALAVHEQFENHAKALSEIDDRIDLLRLQTQSPGIASLELPAQLPDKPESGGRKKIMGIALVFAILLGLGTPTILDLVDPRIKTLGELEASMRMPVMGSALRFDKHASRETLRRIALGILRERRQTGTRVFVMTAIGERAGTTSLTLSLSKELSELGASTAAIEANPYFPDIRYEKQETIGSGPLQKTNPVLSHFDENERNDNGDNIMVHRNVSDLCGHTISRPSNSLGERVPVCQHQRNNRLSMRCIQEVLEMALKTHDIVLLDAPPVLSSADTAMLVQNPAGVIVVVLAERDRLPEVTAAIEELRKLSPPAIGLVLQFEPTDKYETSSAEVSSQEAGAIVHSPTASKVSIATMISGEFTR
jgi:polysaccharide biosynthesis transport protein